MSVNNKLQPLLHETIWFDKPRYDDAERRFHESQAKNIKVPEKEISKPLPSLVNEIASVRERIKETIKGAENFEFNQKNHFAELDAKVEHLYKGQEQISTQIKQISFCLKEVNSLQSKVTNLMNRLCSIENKLADTEILVDEAKFHNDQVTKIDDDIDLFGSGEEDEETSKLRETRLKAYEDKKSKKVPVLAKSFVVLDVKPWNDETDLKEMEKLVRTVETRGLMWGESKLVPVAYGIKSLQIAAVVEDDTVSIDWLQETLQEMENFVQSVDVVVFNKL